MSCSATSSPPRPARRRPLYARAGVAIARIDDAGSTIVAELRTIAGEPVPADELEKARSFAKGRFVLQLESPHGTTMFGLRREVLLGAAEEPEDVLAGLDAVTVDDVQRVAAGGPGGGGPPAPPRAPA